MIHTFSATHDSSVDFHTVFIFNDSNNISRFNFQTNFNKIAGPLGLAVSHSGEDNVNIGDFLPPISRGAYY